MAVDTISVGLDLKHESLRSEFEEILAAQQGFHFMKHDPHRVSDLLILEMEEDRGKTFAQIHAIPTGLLDGNLLTSGQTNSDTTEALRAGVKRVHSTAHSTGRAGRCLTRFKERHKERRPAPAKRGKLITVIGSKGGVGTTTIAVNLAVSLHQAN
jgi:pilus assembly protein CpaE